MKEEGKARKKEERKRKEERKCDTGKKLDEDGKYVVLNVNSVTEMNRM